MSFAGVLEACLYHDASETEAVESFYGEVLGLEAVSRWPGGVSFRVCDTLLLLFEREQLAAKEGPISAHGTRGSGHVCLRAASPDEYERWKERLAGAGVELAHEHRWPNERRSFYFGDPAANLLEIADGDLWPGEAAPRGIDGFDTLTADNWAMTFGDRAALEGVLSLVKPKLAIEIGTAQGGSLARIAAHAGHVHAIDIVRSPQLRLPPNAEFHEGPSGEVLPVLLERIERRGERVDFALVDGDHSAEGVASDLRALLDSEAIARTVIMLHDSFGPGVREGIEAVRPADRDGVVLYQLDFAGGGVCPSGPFSGQMWGGFAIVVVDRSAPDRRLDPMQIWLDGPELVPASLDSWETVIRAEPVIAQIRAESAEATALERLRLALRRRLRAPGPRER